MAAGDEHSAPLKVKYHRLQQLSQPAMRRLPLQKTRSAVLSDVFLKIHSYGNNIETITNLEIRIKTPTLIYLLP